MKFFFSSTYLLILKTLYFKTFFLFLRKVVTTRNINFTITTVVERAVQLCYVHSQRWAADFWNFFILWYWTVHWFFISPPTSPGHPLSALHHYDFDYFRYFVWVESYSICPFYVTGLFHSVLEVLLLSKCTSLDTEASSMATPATFSLVPLPVAWRQQAVSCEAAAGLRRRAAGRGMRWQVSSSVHSWWYLWIVGLERTKPV